MPRKAWGLVDEGRIDEKGGTEVESRSISVIRNVEGRLSRWGDSVLRALLEEMAPKLGRREKKVQGGKAEGSQGVCSSSCWPFLTR